jgi:hypothetical protein
MDQLITLIGYGDAKMKNKKGSSLAELIISIALLSVVLAFMMKMLLDVNNARKNVSYAKDNQIKRAEIIKLIQEDFMDKDIYSIIKTESTSEKLVIEFLFDNNANSKGILQITPTTLTYTPSSGTTKKWTMPDTATLSINDDKSKIVYCNTNNANGNKVSFIINIEVYTENDNNSSSKNNIADDIQISHILDKKKYSCSSDNCLINL